MSENDAPPPVLATAAGLASELYERALVALVDALGEAGDAHWQAWMRVDLEIWRAHRRTDHHGRAYGGMGSFNDRPLAGDPWVETSIKQLSHLTSTTALAAEQTPDRFVQVSGIFSDVSRRWCAECRPKSAEEHELTWVTADAWSSWAIPRMVTDGTLPAREPYVRFVAERTSGLHLCSNRKHVSVSIF